MLQEMLGSESAAVMAVLRDFGLRGSLMSKCEQLKGGSVSTKISMHECIGPVRFAGCVISTDEKKAIRALASEVAVGWWLANQ